MRFGDRYAHDRSDYLVCDGQTVPVPDWSIVRFTIGGTGVGPLVSDPGGLLAVNGGSSSIRFALYNGDETLRRLLAGKVDRGGLSGTTVTSTNAAWQLQDSLAIDTADSRSAVLVLLDWLEAQPAFASVKGVGHRVVHGMAHNEPEAVTPELLDELRRITPYDSEHLPLEIELIEAIRQRYPALPQVACFDTAFHRAMPRVASQLPIPRRYEAAGIRRYGFHGRSPTRHKGMSSEQGAITASAHLDQLGEICFPRPTPGG